MPPLLDQEAAVQGRSMPSVFARWLFARVMERVDVSASMRESVTLQQHQLRVGQQVFDLDRFKRVLLVAIGKASIPMAQHVHDVLHGKVWLKGVVVGTGMWEPPQELRYVQGEHPVPFAGSFEAALACLELVRGADDATLVLYLVSGGASAMAEAPLDPAMSAEDVASFYRAILYSGLPIGPANALRKHFSAIKGGRLAQAAGPATHCTILVSDVPAGQLDVVGSGPSLPDHSTAAECQKLLAEVPTLASLPASFRHFAEVMPETPKRLPEGQMPSSCLCLLSSDSLIEAATPLLHAAGYRVIVDNTCDDWGYEDAARYLVERARAQPAEQQPVCIVSAGEVTVRIDRSSGTGGRNQQWALEAARLIHGADGLVAMSVGSDGIDGNSPAAGAVVDGTTWQRALAAGLDPAAALANFDTHAIFAALGDAITPGPSGNNLRDLRIVFVHPNYRA